MKICIVGSGHAALSAAKAIIAQGYSSVIIDAGETVSPQRMALVDTLSAQEPECWDLNAVSSITANKSISGSSVPRKHVFGSDFLYAENRPAIPAQNIDTRAAQSFTKGGFSLGWGGAMLPTADSDMSNWPFGREALVPYYQKVIHDIPLSAGDDGLQDLFPFYKDDYQTVAIDNQSQALLEDCDKVDGEALRKNGVEFVYGRARLALKASDCRYCGVCLSGCPYGLLYTADQLLDEYIKAEHIEYRSGQVVKRIIENENGITVELSDLAGRALPAQTFDKVFLAAGAMGSSRIMLQSMGNYETELQLLDSEKFAVPFLRHKGAKIDWPQSNSFSSLFFETRFEHISPYWLHMQVSSTNDLILQKLFSKGAYGVNWLGKLASPVISRLMVGFCGLHSDHSPRISMTLKRDGQGADRIEVKKIDNPRTEEIVEEYGKAFRSLGRKFKAEFVPELTQLWEPGITGHCGGSFPMVEKPTKWNETDLKGTPQGYRNLHIVDASVFPSIPGTTVSLLIMANAYRIAEQVLSTDAKND